MKNVIIHSRLCIFTGAEQLIKSKIILDLSCVLLPHQLYALHRLIQCLFFFINHSLHKQNNTIELKVTEFRPSIIFMPILFSLPRPLVNLYHNHCIYHVLVHLQPVGNQ